MKQILSIMFALAFALSGAVGHASMVMDGAGMEHAAHSEHAADHMADGAPLATHATKTGACAAACAAACGFVPPLFLLKQRDFVLDQPVACVRPSLVSAIMGFHPPPPKV
ncbi:MAG: hypothetical protein ACPGSI_10175 [Pikeienuella sp.]